MIDAKAGAEGVLAVEAIKVSLIKLRNYDGDWRLFCQDNTESVLVTCAPRHVDAGPALALPPVRFPEKPCAIQV